MVVLAASVVSKTGKPLVSRQYMEMSRIRIEGLLAAFPKLVGTGKQHTYVETENVRYVYQPMEGLYLLLITNKQSNILEDLETLRLLSKLVPEYSVSLDEESVVSKAFELIFAFDEVIALGHKENVTIQQVKQNCEMESHEEKLHQMIIQSKINDTRDIMKKKAADIEKQKMEQKKMGLGSAMAGFGSSNSKGPSMPMDTDSGPSYRPEPVPVAPTRPAATAGNKGPSKGMKLGSSKKGADILESLAKEGEAVELDLPKAAASSSAGAAKAVALSSEPVSLAIEEKLTVILNKQGGLENLEVQGTMSLVVNTDEDAFIRIAVQSSANKGFQFKTHPNIDKNMYSSSNMLGLKDPARPFPTGSELGILKWRFQSKEESMVPLTITCWPSVSGGESYVNMEYESTDAFDLQNVQIIIPCSQSPTVNQIDGEWRFDSRAGTLIWSIDLIDDTNRSGAMEFVVPATDAEHFYPIELSFSSNKTFCDIAVAGVEHTQKSAPVKYSYNKSMSTAEYQVV